MAELDFTDLIPSQNTGQSISFDDLVPPEKSTGEVLQNLDQQAAAGAIQGAGSMVSAIPNLAGALERGADWLWNRYMPAGPAGPRPSDPGGLTTLAAPGRLGTAAGNVVDQAANTLAASQAGAPTTPAEEAARKVGSYVGGGALGGAGPVRSAIAGLGDVVATKAAEGTGYEPVAGFAGGILAGSLPGVGRKIATPLPISAERQAAIKTLEDAGVPVSAGEASGSKPLLYTEATLSDLPFAGGKLKALKEAQGQALAGEVMGKAGSPGQLMTRENMEEGFKRLGKTYEDIGTRNDLKFDPQFGQDLNKAISDYENSVHIANNKPIVYKEVSKAYNAAIGGGGMSGIQYQDWRSKLGKGVNTLYRNGDTGSAQGLKDIRDALDSAFARSVKNPEDAALLKETNRQYSAMKGVQKGIERAGGDPVLGLLGQNPGATLRAMATGTKGHRGFTDLADAANTILKPLPNSGTAQRLGQGMTLASAMWDLMHGNVPVAALGKTLGGAALGRGLMSAPVQAYLKNQRFAAAPINPQGVALPAFLANQGILAQLPYLGQQP
jgi:hypothetical protein